MIEAGSGAIVNISSDAGRQPGRGSAPYGVAKTGLAHLTTLMAEELAPKVRVNALSLGPIPTPLLETALEQNEGLRERFHQKTPLRRIGDPACVALSTLFLCSEASSYITGAVIPVTGGSAGNPGLFNFPDLWVGDTAAPEKAK